MGSEMRVTRIDSDRGVFTAVKASSWSGKTGHMELPLGKMDVIVTWHAANAAGKNPAFVQDAFPDLTADQREFLISGCTPEDWAAMFPDGDEDEEDGSSEAHGD